MNIELQDRIYHRALHLSDPLFLGHTHTVHLFKSIKEREREWEIAWCINRWERIGPNIFHVCTMLTYFSLDNVCNNWVYFRFKCDVNEDYDHVSEILIGFVRLKVLYSAMFAGDCFCNLTWFRHWFLCFKIYDTKLSLFQ